MKTTLHRSHQIIALLSLAITVGLCGCATKSFRTPQPGRTALMYAVENHDLKKVKYLVEVEKVDVNARCDSSEPLMTQTLTHADGRKEVRNSGGVEKGAGNSALSLAILNQNAKIVKYLVDQGADVNAKVVYFNTTQTMICPGGGLINMRPGKLLPQRTGTILELAKQFGNSEILRVIESKVGQK